MTPCSGCKHRQSLFGMAYCTLNEWAGKDNERICARYQREPIKGE